MPIRPENRARYPKHWKAVVAQVRERSGNCCEGSPAFPDCRVPHGVVGYRDAGRWVQLGVSIDDAGLAIDAAIEDGFKVTRIVLTTGHLDHLPEHCDLTNLRHWCQRCHLHYDRQHHNETAYATRRASKASGDLFDGVTEAAQAA
jgi:glyoxylase-like metal-dependent hydrolase (beta-lactamase superfamily II)